MMCTRQLRCLVEQLQSGSTSADRADAVDRLRYLAREPKLNLRLLAAGAAPALVEALGGSDADTVEAAAAALGNLTTHRTSASAAVVAAGAVPALARLLRRRGSTDAQRQHAACTLRNLAYDSSAYSQAIVDEGIPESQL